MRPHTTHHDDCGCLSERYEKRIAELEAQIEWWKGVLHRTNVEWKKDATKGRVQEERAEKAEAALAECEFQQATQDDKDYISVLKAELYAERGKRCDLCGRPFVEGDAME